MAIIDGLTTLASVKAELGITDTTQDTLLEALISGISAQIGVYLKRTLKKTTHLTEPYAVNNMLSLYLKDYPIQSVSEVKLSGAVLSSGSGYFLSGEDALAGRLYREQGWMGKTLQRGTFPDTFSGARDVTVSYVSGYLLPADVGYVAGNSDSLPMAIQFACNRAVCERFRATESQSDNLDSLTEGGLSYDFTDTMRTVSGLSQTVEAMLCAYKRIEVA